MQQRNSSFTIYKETAKRIDRAGKGIAQRFQQSNTSVAAPPLGFKSNYSGYYFGLGNGDGRGGGFPTGGLGVPGGFGVPGG